MRSSILAFALLTSAGTVAAAPSLIASTDAKGGVTLEFVADSAAPVNAVLIELPLVIKAKVSEQCIKAPSGFAALCNVDNQVFKALVYSTNPDAAIPSAMLGRVELPAGAVSLAKSGELDGLKMSGSDSAAASVVGEVLSQGPTGQRATSVQEK